MSASAASSASALRAWANALACASTRAASAASASATRLASSSASRAARSSCCRRSNSARSTLCSYSRLGAMSVSTSVSTTETPPPVAVSGLTSMTSRVYVLSVDATYTPIDSPTVSVLCAASARSSTARTLTTSAEKSDVAGRNFAYVALGSLRNDTSTCDSRVASAGPPSPPSCSGASALSPSCASTCGGSPTVSASAAKSNAATCALLPPRRTSQVLAPPALPARRSA
mmetsp:Transcript_13971/g.43779  ORF Transcript_13971/g.43779 Transcript_13971/m.43779 type:complete len:230 (-) Transcript_13971:500-1189(-)